MNDPIDWLQVVLDYGKRNPKVTYGQIVGDGVIVTLKYTKMCDLVISNNYLKDASGYYYFRLFLNGDIRYWLESDYKQVPPQILLRLLTEGKEDLI